MQGYTGADCTTQCPYPTYGDKCQGTLKNFTTGGYFFLNFVNIYTFPSQNN